MVKRRNKPVGPFHQRLACQRRGQGQSRGIRRGIGATRGWHGAVPRGPGPPQRLGAVGDAEEDAPEEAQGHDDAEQDDPERRASGPAPALGSAVNLGEAAQRGGLARPRRCAARRCGTGR